MMDNSCNVISDFITVFTNITKNPEEFLEVQKDDSEKVKVLVKNIYDFVKNVENNTTGNALPELIIENFDEEQIWQEIELQNNDNIDKFAAGVTWLSEKKDQLIFPTKNKEDKNAAKKNIKLDKKCVNKMEVNEDSDVDEDSEESEDDLPFNDAEIESDYESSDSQISKNKSKKDKKGKQKPSVVDDKFFKLSEMEEFLLAEEKQEEKAYDETGFGIDLFEDLPSSDNEDEENDRVRYRYKDFFAEPSRNAVSLLNKNVKARLNENGDYDIENESYNGKINSVSENKIKEKFINNENDFSLEIEDEDEKKEEDEDVGDDLDEEGDDNINSGKQVRFNLSDEEDDDSGENDNNDRLSATESDESISEKDNEKENKRDKSDKVKSTLEKRKERLSKHIRNLEDRALSEKPWQMKGEITATSRPQNSLLEEVLEFDVASRPAPVMTEETTERLEDIIIRRVKDKAWDDVERKLKPVETVNEFKKRLVLDQEKSKLSLAQIYEQEYIKQRDAAAAVGLKAEEKEPEELPEHKQVKAMMVSLFSKLNALANFHYTPKPATPDIKIVSNLPAVTMEEVAPVAASDAALLAPEEVMGKKKKELIGKEERTKTDKKRERRKKKNWQKTRSKLLEAKELSKDNKSKKYTVENAAKDLKKLANNRGVQIDSSGSKKAIKTSTSFFSRLQDEVKSKVQGQSKSKKVDKNKISAKKLKL